MAFVDMGDSGPILCACYKAYAFVICNALFSFNAVVDWHLSIASSETSITTSGGRKV